MNIIPALPVQLIQGPRGPIGPGGPPGTIVNLPETLESMGVRPTIYVLAMGESNMARGSGAGFGLAPYDLTPDDNVQIWNTSSLAWQKWDPSLAISQNNQFGSAVSVIPFHFAKALAQRRGALVRVVAAAANGINIAQWNTGSPKWTVMVNVIAAAAISRIDVVLWHQGINDNTDTGYKTKLLDLIARVRALPWFADNSLWVSGYAMNQFGVLNSQYASLADRTVYPHVRVAVCNDRPVRAGDPNHFTDESIALMGSIDYLEAYLSSGEKPTQTGSGSKFVSNYWLNAARDQHINLPAAVLPVFRDSFTFLIDFVEIYPKYLNDTLPQRYILEIGRTNLFNGLLGLRLESNGIGFWTDDLFTKLVNSGPVATTALNVRERKRVAITRNSTTGLINLWLNGVLVATATQGIGELAAATSGRIGVASDGVYGRASLLINEVTLHSRVLTEAEMIKGQTPSGASLRYRCEGYKPGAADEIPDSSGNARHGTMSGTGVDLSWRGSVMQITTE